MLKDGYDYLDKFDVIVYKGSFLRYSSESKTYRVYVIDLGYLSKSKTYRVYVIDSEKVVENHDIKLDGN